MTHKQRSVHRPITITVETVSLLPSVRELPTETQMTANLKFEQRTRKELIDLFLERAFLDKLEKRELLFDLLEEALASDPLGLYPLIVTITGPS